jgi:hypothetical protein
MRRSRKKPYCLFNEGHETEVSEALEIERKTHMSIAKAVDGMDLPLEEVILTSARPTLGTPRIGRAARAVQAAQVAGGLGEAAGGAANVAAAASAVEANQAAVEANQAVEAQANAANAQAAGGV